MLKLGDFIRALKSNVRLSDWSCGKISTKQFPAFKRKFPAGSDWDWRVATFDALGRSFRLLIRLNAGKAYYSSILALEDGPVIQIICRHEFHFSHRNWHCHFIPGDVASTMPGVLRDRDRMRIFDARPSQQGRVEFNVSQDKSVTVAFDRFRIQHPSSDERQSVLI